MFCSLNIPRVQPSDFVRLNFRLNDRNGALVAEGSTGPVNVIDDHKNPSRAVGKVRAAGSSDTPTLVLKKERKSAIRTVTEATQPSSAMSFTPFPSLEVPVEDLSVQDYPNDTSVPNFPNAPLTALASPGVPPVFRLAPGTISAGYILPLQDA